MPKGVYIRTAKHRKSLSKASKEVHSRPEVKAKMRLASSLRCGELRSEKAKANMKGKCGVYVRTKEHRMRLSKSPITLICQNCGNEFKVIPYRKNAKCCSQKCMGEASRGRRITQNCPVCGKKFEALVSSKQEYCSRKCMGQGIKKARMETLIKNGTGTGNPNLFSCEFFKYFDIRLGTEGRYGLNEKWIWDSVLKRYYRPDYFNKEIKLIIEYDEEGHYNVNGELRECDKIKQKCIQERFSDFAFIRVRERNYFPEKKYFNDLTDEDLKVFERMANDLLPQKSPFVII